MSQKYILSELKIRKTDLVDAGANPGANVVLFKRDGEDAAAWIAEPLRKADEAEAASFDEALAETEGRAEAWRVLDQVYPLMEALGKSIGSIFEAESGTTRKSKLKESIGQFVKEVGDRLGQIAKARIPATELAKLTKAATVHKDTKRKEGTDMDEAQVQALLDAAIEKATKPLTEKLGTLNDENEKLRKRLAGVAPTAEPDTTPVTKADLELLAPASRKAVEKQATENAELRQEVQKIKHDHAISTEAARIEKLYPNLPEDPRQAAEDYLALPTDESRARFNKRCEMANLNVTESIGVQGFDTRNSDGTDPYQELQKKAHEIQKAEGGTHTNAMNTALERNPDLALQLEGEA